jgi:RNA polymerase sigma factor (sigma-70 family)
VDAADQELYEKYAAELTRFATAVVGPGDAEDVVSSAVLKAMYSRRWAGVRNPRAYLYRAVLNEARSLQRSSSRRLRREQGVSIRDGFNPENLHPEVLDAVRDLSVRQRAVVMLTYWSDLDPRSIGLLIGISEGTVKRHLARARAKLRERLDDDIG